MIVSEENDRCRGNPNAQNLNLQEGQQCVGDFLVALTLNQFAWLDVFHLLAFQMIEETQCSNRNCKNSNSSTNPPRLYHEMEVPPQGSDLSYFVEKELHNFFTVEDYHCEKQFGGCDHTLNANHRTMIRTLTDKHFILVHLRRLTQM